MIAGYNCADEKISVFERLGNCAQFDVIWEGRTVKQHIEFFARLKGLPTKEVVSAARSIAVAVGLGEEDVYQRNAGVLSGGMRRRLSLGISLIGSPKVLILDEPTTGLDPATRSNIWNLVNSFSSNDRSIIITTHMMIEADTLCDRIAIISNGKLKVVGTQQHLKNNFGSGYLLQLNLLNRSSEDRAMAFVRKHLHPKATIGGRQGKTLRVNLPQDLKLERMFSALYSEERATEGCINQFLLSQSSLEDVFIAIGDD
jgi:ABC-type multidrug transport system ATPase subunit